MFETLDDARAFIEGAEQGAREALEYIDNHG